MEIKLSVKEIYQDSISYSRRDKQQLNAVGPLLSKLNVKMKCGRIISRH